MIATRRKTSRCARSAADIRICFHTSVQYEIKENGRRMTLETGDAELFPSSLKCQHKYRKLRWAHQNKKHTASVSGRNGMVSCNLLLSPFSFVEVIAQASLRSRTFCSQCHALLLVQSIHECIKISTFVDHVESPRHRCLHFTTRIYKSCLVATRSKLVLLAVMTSHSPISTYKMQRPVEIKHNISTVSLIQHNHVLTQINHRNISHS